MKLVYQFLLLCGFALLILAEESTEKNSDVEEEKTDPSPPEDDDNDVTVQPVNKKNKNKPKDKEELTTKKPETEFPGFLPFQPYPEFYYPNIKPRLIPGPFYNPYRGYPFNPRFGGEFPGLFPILPEPKKEKPDEEEKKSKDEKPDKDEKDDKSEEKETDKEEDDKKPGVSIIRVLQLPYLPPLRGWPSRVLPPIDPLANTIGYDSGFNPGFAQRVGNPYLGYSGSPFLGPNLSGFAPYALRRSPIF